MTKRVRKASDFVAADRTDFSNNFRVKYIDPADTTGLNVVNQTTGKD